MFVSAEVERPFSNLDGLVHEQFTIPTLEVIGNLGVAETLLDSQHDLVPFKTWLPVSTNKKLYPDSLIVDYARWAEHHSDGFTVVVSDWLQRYIWVAMRGDWDAQHEGKHIESLERNADKRVETIRRLLHENRIGGRAVVWSEMLFYEMPEALGGRWASDYLHQVFEVSCDPYHNPEFSEDLIQLIHTLAPHVRQRAVDNGNSPYFVDHALKWYGADEIFLTQLMAMTGKANIKLGPRHERHYDEMTLSYMQPDGYTKTGSMKDVPFGAVYLDYAKSKAL